MQRLIQEKDKQQHILVCLLLVFMFSYLLQTGLVVFLVLLIGLGKEIWDKYYGTGFCWYDMLANVIGIGLALNIQFLLQRL